MAVSKPLGTYGNGVGTVTPLDHKLAHLGMAVKTSGNAIRPGLFWGGSATVVSGKPTMTYDIAAFTAVLSRSAAAGAVFLANDGVVNVATTAAPGSNSRIDIIYVWAREFSLDGVDSNPVLGVAQGTAAAVPVAPSIPTGALEIGRATVSAGITATTSATITQTAPFTAMAGGTVVVRTTTERDAGTWTEGQRIYVLNMDIEQVYSGSTWLDLETARLQLDTTNSIVRTITQVGMGKITGNNTVDVSESVTFPTAFASVPVVVTNYIGSRATGAYNTTGLTTTSAITSSAQTPSTTGFTSRFLGASALSNTLDWYYSWIAIGVPA